MTLTDRELIVAALGATADPSLTPNPRLIRIAAYLNEFLDRYDRDGDAWAEQDDINHIFEDAAGDDREVDSPIAITRVG